MRKLSFKARLRALRVLKLAAHRNANARMRRAIRQQRRILGLHGVSVHRTVTVFRDGRYELASITGDARPVPAHLSFSRNHEETVTFLGELRRTLTEYWRPPPSRKERRRRARGPVSYRSYWDFTSIESITPVVALVIAAEYDRMRRRGGWVMRAIEYEKWNPQVRAFLDGVGFLRLTGVDGTGGDFLDGPDWRLLRMRSGETADGEIVSKVLSQLGVPELIDDADVYGAIIEALVNTRHHAYPEGHKLPEPFVGDWWLTGFVNRKSGQVWLAVYDQGVTIPVTLPSWERFPSYRRAFKRLLGREVDVADKSYDGAAIALAMAAGRTSTGLSYRGRGLPAMEAAVNLCRAGSITILSRCGEYHRRKGGKPTYRNWNCELGGTLVMWDLQFKGSEA